jgi:hypothetical protein
MLSSIERREEQLGIIVLERGISAGIGWFFRMPEIIDRRPTG